MPEEVPLEMAACIDKHDSTGGGGGGGGGEGYEAGTGQSRAGGGGECGWDRDHQPSQTSAIGHTPHTHSRMHTPFTRATGEITIPL